MKSYIQERCARVTSWLRNRNTMEFLGVWERIYNPNFNYGEFNAIRNQAGLNNFKISVKEFVAHTEYWRAKTLCIGNCK